jgi:hypothetical protein
MMTSNREEERPTILIHDRMTEFRYVNGYFLTAELLFSGVEI